jgi:hypothetical protein
MKINRAMEGHHVERGHHSQGLKRHPQRAYQDLLSRSEPSDSQHKFQGVPGAVTAKAAQRSTIFS